MENQSHIRNFVIIAHIDHGKSTLADRFLDLTKTIPEGKMRPQYLDMMDLERERGITIKMQPVRMIYHAEIQNSKFKIQNSGSEFILNLIDTPGHVDFSYEVSRSLAAVEGAILLVDATKGIQAQTIANLELAKKQNLIIIPAVNKIDSPQAKIEETKTELANLLNIKKEDVFLISAKLGTNVEKLLAAIIKKIPCPSTLPDFVEGGFRALIFDSKYDPYKGVIACVRVFDGEIKVGEKIYLLAAGTEGEVKELGYFSPTLSSQKALRAGEIGYIATGVKESGKVRVGDTITKLKVKSEKFKVIGAEPLPGYKEPKPMVFASIYPEDQNDYDLLKDALSKLKLNDASLVFEPESREFLGRGFRSGFLGTLHAEIVSERLKREFGLNLVISTPSVLYKIIKENAQEIFVKSASDWPQATQIKEIREPWIRLEIITPSNYLGKCMEVLEGTEGKYIETKYISQERILLVYEVPLREIMSGFYAQLKGKTQGFASMNYEILDWRRADLVKLEILIAGRKEEVLSKIVSRNSVHLEGKKMVERLKEIVPSQLFSVALQAAVENQIIARETIKAKRRDVIAPLYGGDYSRKRKLLERQKKGKKELKEKGVVRIPPDVFLKMFTS
ncbi:translation elongation factor 4 [Patescibacteria group bacterium]|nr:translation elongation factor 4 [Patescibacteria group bacterium]